MLTEGYIREIIPPAAAHPTRESEEAERARRVTAAKFHESLHNATPATETAAMAGFLQGRKHADEQIAQQEARRERELQARRARGETIGR